MNTNISETLTQSLSLITYNGSTIATPKDNQLNLWMGVGFCSVRDGLSVGLPVDVMQMLLSATIMHAQVREANRGKSPKVIILIADSMALREGAEKEKVSRLIRVYKQSLEPLLDLLKLKECSEIILSSEIESSQQYKETLQTLDNSSLMKQLKIQDETHYAYIRTQTAITRYMNKFKQAGIKIGWINAESSKLLATRMSPQSLKQWDELKFDRWCETVYNDSTMQYLYTRAGLKQPRHEKHISVNEGCPYTAYPKDQRYIVQAQNKKDIKTICPIQKRVANHWMGIAEICATLMQANLVNDTLLPKDCIKKNNTTATVYNLLNHWANPPAPSKKIVYELASVLLPDYTYSLTLEDSYRQPLMLDMRYLLSQKKVVDKPQVLKKCILL